MDGAGVHGDGGALIIFDLRILIPMDVTHGDGAAAGILRLDRALERVQFHVAVADHSQILQVDVAVVYVDDQLGAAQVTRAVHDLVVRDGQVAFLHVDVGIGLKGSVAFQILEDHKTVHLDGILGGADGASGGAHDGDGTAAVAGGDIVLGHSVAVQQAAVRIRHDDGHVLAGHFADLIIGAGDVDHLFGLRAVRNDHRAVGTNDGAVLQGHVLAGPHDQLLVCGGGGEILISHDMLRGKLVDRVPHAGIHDVVVTRRADGQHAPGGGRHVGEGDGVVLDGQLLCAVHGQGGDGLVTTSQRHAGLLIHVDGHAAVGGRRRGQRLPHAAHVLVVDAQHALGDGSLFEAGDALQIHLLCSASRTVDVLEGNGGRVQGIVGRLLHVGDDHALGLVAAVDAVIQCGEGCAIACHSDDLLAGIDGIGRGLELHSLAIHGDVQALSDPEALGAAAGQVVVGQESGVDLYVVNLADQLHAGGAGHEGYVVLAVMGSYGQTGGFRGGGSQRVVVAFDPLTRVRLVASSSVGGFAFPAYPLVAIRQRCAIGGVNLIDVQVMDTIVDQRLNEVIQIAAGTLYRSVNLKLIARSLLERRNCTSSHAVLIHIVPAVAFPVPVDEELTSRLYTCKISEVVQAACPVTLPGIVVRVLYIVADVAAVQVDPDVGVRSAVIEGVGQGFIVLVVVAARAGSRQLAVGIAGTRDAQTAQQVSLEAVAGGVMSEHIRCQTGIGAAYHVGSRGAAVQVVVGDVARGVPLHQRGGAFVGGSFMLVVSRRLGQRIAVPEGELIAQLAGLIKQPVGAQRGQQRLESIAFLDGQRRVGQVEGNARLQRDLVGHRIVGVVGQTEVHAAFDDADDAAFAVGVEGRTVGQEVCVHAGRHVVAGLIVAQRSTVGDDGIGGQAHKRVGHILQGAGSRHYHSGGTRQPGHADSLVQQDIHVARSLHAVGAHVGIKRVRAGELIQLVDYLQLGRRQGQPDIAVGAYVHGSFLIIQREHPHHEAVGIAAADVGSAFDQQLVGPDGSHNARAGDAGVLLDTGQVAADCGGDLLPCLVEGNPLEVDLAPVIGKESCHMHAAVAEALHGEDGRGDVGFPDHHGGPLGAGHAGEVHIGLDVVIIVEGHVAQNQIGVRVVGDGHVGNVELVVHGVGVVLAHIAHGQIAGKVVADSGEGHLVIADGPDGILTLQADLTNLNLTVLVVVHVDDDARGSVADVELGGRIHRLGGGLADALVAFPVAVDCAAVVAEEISRAFVDNVADVHVSAVEDHAVAHGGDGVGVKVHVDGGGAVAQSAQIGVGAAHHILCLVGGIDAGHNVDQVIAAQGCIVGTGIVVDLHGQVGRRVHVGAQRLDGGMSLVFNTQPGGGGQQVEVTSLDVRTVGAVAVHRCVAVEIHVGIGTSVGTAAQTGRIRLGEGVQVVHGSVGPDSDLTEGVPDVCTVHIDGGAGSHPGGGLGIAEAGEAAGFQTGDGIDVVESAGLGQDLDGTEVARNAGAAVHVDGGFAVQLILRLQGALGGEAAGCVRRRLSIHHSLGEGLENHVAHSVDGAAAQRHGVDHVLGVVAVHMHDRHRKADLAGLGIGGGLGLVLGQHLHIAAGVHRGVVADGCIGAVVAVGGYVGRGYTAHRPLGIALVDDGLSPAGVDRLDRHVLHHIDGGAVADGGRYGLTGVAAMADVSVGRGDFTVDQVQGASQRFGPGKRVGGGVRQNLHVGGVDGTAGHVSRHHVLGVGAGLQAAEGSEGEAHTVDVALGGSGAAVSQGLGDDLQITHVQHAAAAGEGSLHFSLAVGGNLVQIHLQTGDGTGGAADVSLRAHSVGIRVGEPVGGLDGQAAAHVQIAAVVEGRVLLGAQVRFHLVGGDGSARNFHLHGTALRKGVGLTLGQHVGAALDDGRIVLCSGAAHGGVGLNARSRHSLVDLGRVQAAGQRAGCAGVRLRIRGEVRDHVSVVQGGPLPQRSGGREYAVGLGCGIHIGGVVQADAVAAQYVGQGNGGRVGLDVQVAAELHGGVLHRSGGLRSHVGDCKVHVHACQLQAHRRAAAVAAHLGGSGGGGAAPILVEVGFHRQAGGGQVSIGDLRSLGAACHSLCMVGGNLDAGEAHQRGGDGGVGLHGTVGDDLHRAGGYQLAAAGDLIGGVCAGPGVGRVHVHVRQAQAHAAEGLGSLRIGVRGVGIGEGHGGGFQRLARAQRQLAGEGAVGLGVNHVHTDADHVAAYSVLHHGRVGFAAAAGSHLQRAGQLAVHVVHDGLTDSSILGDSHIGLGGDEADGNLVVLGIQTGTAQLGFRRLTAGVEVRGYGQAGGVQFHVLSLGRLIGLDQRHSGVGSHVHSVCAEDGSLHLCPGVGFRVGRHDNSLGIDLARAGEYSLHGRLRRCYGHVGVNAVHSALDHAVCGGSHVGVSVGGHVLDLHVDAARVHLGARRHVQFSLEDALRVGEARHHADGQTSRLVIIDVGADAGLAGAQHVHAAADGHATRGSTCDGLAAAVGHAHVHRTCDQRAAAGGSRHLCGFLHTGVQAGNHVQAGSADHTAVDFGALLIAQHGNQRRGADSGASRVQAHQSGLSGGAAVGFHSQGTGGSQGARRIALDGSNVAGAVVGDGHVGVDAHAGQSGGDGGSLGSHPVAVVLTARVHADGTGGHSGTGHVNDRLVVGPQLHIGNACAHSRSAHSRGGELGLGGGVHVSVHGDGLCADALADDTGDGFGLVDDRHHGAGEGRRAALDREHHRIGSAGDVALHGYVSLGGGDAARGGAAFFPGIHADVGVDIGQNHGDRAGHTRCHRAAGQIHQVDVGVGIGGVGHGQAGHVRRVHGHAVADEGVDFHAVDGHGQAGVDGYRAARDCCGEGGGIGVCVGMNRYALHVLDIGAAADGGFHLGLHQSQGIGGVHCSHAAGGSAGHSQGIGIVHQSLNLQLVRLHHVARHDGDGLVVQRYDGAGHTHARDTARAGHGDGADGTGQDGVLALVGGDHVGDQGVAVAFSLLISLILRVGGSELHAVGSRLHGDVTLGLESRALVDLGYHVGVQHGGSHTQTHACVEAHGAGHGDHVGLHHVVGEDTDIRCGDDGHAAADLRRHSAGRIVGGHVAADTGGTLHVRAAFADLVILAAAGFVVLIVVASAAEVAGNVAAFSVKLAVFVAEVNLGVAYAVAFQLGTQPGHAVLLFFAVLVGVLKIGRIGHAEGLAAEAFSVEALALAVFVGIEQGVGGVLIHLAAGHGHHDGARHAHLTARHGTRIEANVAHRVRGNVHIAGGGFNPAGTRCEARGDFVVQHGHAGGNAHAGHAAAGHIGNHADELHAVLCSQRDFGALDAGIFHAQRAGLLLADADDNRAADAGGAAGGHAGCVGGDQFIGGCPDVHGALRVDIGVSQHLRIGLAFKVGDHSHGRHGGSAAHAHRSRNVDEVALAVCQHVHIAARGHIAAEMRVDHALERQRACAHVHRSSTAAAEAQRQQIHAVCRNSLGRHIALCLGDSRFVDRFNLLVVDGHHGRGAYACSTADAHAAGQIVYMRLIVGFDCNLGVAGAAVIVLIPCRQTAAGAYGGLHRVLHDLGVDYACHACRTGCTAADGSHQQLGAGGCGDHDASALVGTAGQRHAAGGAGGIVQDGMSQHDGVRTHGGVNLVVHNHGGQGCARAGVAACSHGSGCIVQARIQISVDHDGVAGSDAGHVAHAGGNLGLADDHGDGAADSRLSACRARDGDDDALLLALGCDDNVLALAQRRGDQIRILAHDGKHLLLEDAHVHRCAHRRAAGGAGGGGHDHYLIGRAVGTDFQYAVQGFDVSLVANLGPGGGAGDDHAQRTRHGGAGAYAAGQGSQHVDQQLAALGLKLHVAGSHGLRAVAQIDLGMVLGYDHRKGAASSHAAGRTGHACGVRQQYAVVPRVNIDAAGLRRQIAVAHGRLDGVAGDDHIDAAAHRRAAGLRRRAGRHGHEQGIAGVGRLLIDEGRGNRRAVADGGDSLVLVVDSGNVHARAHLLGGSQRAADQTGLGFAGGFHVEAAGQGDDRAVAHRSIGLVLREEHRRAAADGCAGVSAAGDGARDGLHIVVDGSEVVQRVSQLEQIVGAEVHFQTIAVRLTLVGALAVGDLQVDQTLAGRIVRRYIDGKERLKTHGELVVGGLDHLLVSLQFQAGGGDGGLRAHGSIGLIVGVEHREGSTHTHGLTADVHRTGAQSQLGLVGSHHGDFAAVDHGVVRDHGAGLRLSVHHGHRTGKAYLAAAAAADAAGQRLRCQQTGILAVLILGVGGMHVHRAVIGGSGLAAGGVHFAARGCGGLVVIHRDRHAHGDVVGVGIEGHRCTGAQGAEVVAAFRHNVHLLRGEIAQHFGNRLMLGNVHAQSRRNVDLLLVVLHLLTGGAGAAALQRCISLAGTGGRGGGLDIQHTKDGGHQRHAGGSACQIAQILVDNVVHHQGVEGAGAGTGSHVQEIHQRAQLLEIALQACAGHHGQRVSLVLIGGEGFHAGTAGDHAVAAQHSLDRRRGDVDRHRGAHRRAAAHRKAGGLGQHLTALIGAQVEIVLIGILVVAEGDLVATVQDKIAALIHGRQHLIADHGQRHGRIHRDVLGGGVVGIHDLGLLGAVAQSGNVLVPALLHRDGILTGDGNGIHVVMQDCFDAQRRRLHAAVLTQHGIGGNVGVAYGDGSTHAHGLAAALLTGGAGAVQVLVGQTVIGSGSGGGGVNQLRAVRVEQDLAAGTYVCLGGKRVASGDGGFGPALQDGQRQTAGYAHIGRARTGDGHGGDGAAGALDFAGIAEALGQRDGHSLAQGVNGHLCAQTALGHKLLELTPCPAGSQQQADHEFGVRQNVLQIAEGGGYQLAQDGRAGFHRLVLQFAHQGIDDALNHQILLIRGQLFKVLVALQQLGQSAHALLLQQSVDQNIPALGVCEELQKLCEDLVQVALRLGLVHVCADDDIAIRMDAAGTDAGYVGILNVVDRCRHAHARRGAHRRGVGLDSRVGVMTGSHMDAAGGIHVSAVGDAGDGLVAHHVDGHRSRHLNAAFVGLHVGPLARQVVHLGDGNPAGHRLELAGQAGQSGHALVSRLVGLTLVEGRGGILVVRAVRIQLLGRTVLHQIIQIGLCVGVGGIAGCGRGGGSADALGAGLDLLRHAADGARVHLHVRAGDAAAQQSLRAVGDQVQTHACTHAHAVGQDGRIHHQLARNISRRNYVHVARGDQRVARTHLRQRVHAAKAQSHHGCNAGTAGSACRSLDVVGAGHGGFHVHAGQRSAVGKVELHAVLNERQRFHADDVHRDTRANALAACQ